MKKVLYIRYKPVKPSILKMQQLELGNSDLGETNFVGKRMKIYTPHKVKILRTSDIFSLTYR
jgi:hypothetical protein